MRWLIPFWVSYPITSCCLSVSKLLVLNRLMAFSKRLPTQASLGRIVVGTIVVGSALGLCVNIAASVFLSRAYTAFDAAASSNSTEDFQRGNQERSNAQFAGAFHLFFETLMLLLVVIGLTLGGVSSARRFHSVLMSSDQQIANLSGSHRSHELASVTQQQQNIRTLRVQVLVTCAVLFFSFLLRAVYVTMFALAGALNDNSRDCPSYVNRCSDCYNIFAHVNIWLLYTPEFFCAVVFISEPVALLVALWGMTSGQALVVLTRQFKRQHQVQVSLPRRMVDDPS
jgi:hypothetical protein